MMSQQNPAPGSGFDYTSLPKANHDDYELEEARTGWTFQGVGRIAIFTYLAALVLCIVLMGTQTTSPIPDANFYAAATISLAPLFSGLIGLFRKVGRWWSLVSLLASVIVNTCFLSIVFILFAQVVMF